MRIAIVGGPRSGKTELAKKLGLQLGITVKSTDSLAGSWSEMSRVASMCFDELGPLIVEGVAVPRALRKFLERSFQRRPVDQVYVLTRPWVELTKEQEAMSKGCATVFHEIKDELVKRGVKITIV